MIISRGQNDLSSIGTKKMTMIINLMRAFLAIGLDLLSNVDDDDNDNVNNDIYDDQYLVKSEVEHISWNKGCCNCGFFLGQSSS